MRRSWYNNSYIYQMFIQRFCWWNNGGTIVFKYVISDTHWFVSLRNVQKRIYSIKKLWEHKLNHRLYTRSCFQFLRNWETFELLLKKQTQDLRSPRRNLRARRPRCPRRCLWWPKEKTGHENWGVKSWASNNCNWVLWIMWVSMLVSIFFIVLMLTPVADSAFNPWIGLGCHGITGFSDP